jgi:hypothetical protein
LDDEIGRNPMCRRHWLFTKALEIAPFEEAFALAQRVEDFISGGTQNNALHSFSGVTPSATLRAPPKAKGTRQKPLGGLANMASPLMAGVEALAESDLVSIDR